MIKLFTVGSLIFLCVAMQACTEPPPPPAAEQHRYVYSAKYVCGQKGLVPGMYKTAINIQNPFDVQVSFQKKVVAAHPQRDPRGPISGKIQESLAPNEAVEVDCQDIEQHLPNEPTGFVVVESTEDNLVVTAVYTSLVQVEKQDFVCLNKFFFFDNRPVTQPGTTPLDPPGQVHEEKVETAFLVTLPCPPPPIEVDVNPQRPDVEMVPNGVNNADIVNQGTNPVTVTSGAGAPVTVAAGAAASIPVTPGQQITIAGGPARVSKTFGINDLQEMIRRRTGKPNIVIAKKIKTTERINKILFIIGGPLEGVRPTTGAEGGLAQSSEGAALPKGLDTGASLELLLPAPAENQVMNLEAEVRERLEIPPEFPVRIVDVELGVGKGLSTQGPLGEMGVGNGVGVGAGISIDVERIYPLKTPVVKQ